ncbi:MAG TPA: hypothetical protein VEK57_29575 [Thermoanaerobaculia bacterium]|nr:hypothetical protein [Thermoanaerobaculia bacterium]
MSVMPLPALAVPADAGATGSPPSTQLSVSAALDFNGQPVYISTGNLLDAGGITMTFSLTNPVVVGDLQDFIIWAAGQFGVTVTIADITGVINQIPSALDWLKSGLNSILTAQLVLTIVNINIQPGRPLYAQVGATINFINPIGPSWLNLTQLGFTFTQGQTTASPA